MSTLIRLSVTYSDQESRSVEKYGHRFNGIRTHHGTLVARTEVHLPQQAYWITVEFHLQHL